MEVHSSRRRARARRDGRASRRATAGTGATLKDGEPPEEDPTLEHPRCVFQLLQAPLRALHARARRARSAACRATQFLARLRGALRELRAASGRRRSSTPSAGRSTPSASSTSARPRSSSSCSATSAGPGGGIMALRGHASIQGSTDIPTLYNILPGYIPMPHAKRARRASRVHRAEPSRRPASGGTWAPTPSACSRRTGATRRHAENDFCFDYLPRITATTGTYQTALDMARRRGARLHRRRREPRGRVGERPPAARGAARRPKWLVVRDLVEIETASFWYDSPEVERGELRTDEIGTEVFFLPAAAHAEKDGSFTNTQRLLQWHHKAVEPPGDCRSDLWFYFHLGPDRSARSSRRGRAPTTATGRCSTWPGTTRSSGEHRRAVRRGRAARDQRLRARTAGRSRPTPSSRTTARRPAAAGSTAAATPTGPTRRPGARAGHEQSWVAPEWGWAWPANRRILYNRASADPDGRPWSERKRYVWWDAERGTLDGRGRARLPARQAAGLRTARRREGRGRDRRRPPVHHAGRRARLAVRPGRARRRAAADALRAARVAVREPALRAARQSRAPAVPAPAQPLQPERRRARRGDVPLRLHDLPPDRAPHGGRDEPVRCRTSPSCSRRCSARSARSWPPSAGSSTAAGRRSRPAAPRSRRACMVTERMRPLAVQGRPRAPDRAALPLGQPRPHHRRLGQRPAADRARPQRPHPGEQGRDLRHPPGTTAAERCGDDDSRSSIGQPGCHLRRAVARARRLLHRHERVHRLQGLRGRLQGVERRPRGRPRCSPATRTTTPASSAPTPGGTSRSSSRRRPLRVPADGAARRRAVPLADELGRVQALHPRRLPRRLPDRGARSAPSSARSSCRRTSATAAATASPRARSASSTDARSRARTARAWPEVHALLRPPRRTDRRRPAPRPARPSRSSSGRSTSCGARAADRLDEVQRRGLRGRAPVRRATRATASAGSARSSCCSTSPRCTACRPIRS